MPLNKNTLFYDQNIRVEFSERRGQLLSKLEKLEEKDLMNTDFDELCQYFVQKYVFIPPQMNEDKIDVTPGEADVDATAYCSYNGERPKEKVSTIIFNIPFDGDISLIKYRPNQFTTKLPRATVLDDSISITYMVSDYDSISIVNANFEREKAEIKKYLEWLSIDIQDFNNRIKIEINSNLKSRKDKILKMRGFVEKIGYPLRRRDDAPFTYKFPIERKKLSISFPKPNTNPLASDPFLEMKDYDEILNVLSHMAITMERSPNAFKKMKEEDLRWLFLIPLNGLFEGQATGETFNCKGQTDILIRVNGKNIFIGECKFWDGPKHLTKTIDQVLGYTSWRDTKVAILLFNKNKNTMDTIPKIDDTAKKHPNFKRALDYKSDSGYRYVFSHMNDANKEFVLTILAFDIPQEDATEKEKD
jgi:hypothetical protein